MKPRPSLRPTGTPPHKVVTLVPGENRTHHAHYEADEIDRRTLRGDRRTRFQQRATLRAISINDYPEDES